MALDYDNELEEMTLTCDSCGDDETNKGEFNDALMEFKSDGWRVFKQGSDWCHLCPNCKRL